MAMVFAMSLASSIRKLSTVGRLEMLSFLPSRCLYILLETAHYFFQRVRIAAILFLTSYSQLDTFPLSPSWPDVPDHCLSASAQKAIHLINVFFSLSINACHYLGWGGWWLAALWQPLGEGSPRVHASCAILWQNRASSWWRQMGWHSGENMI